MNKLLPTINPALGKFTPKPRRLDRLAKQILRQRLKPLQHGTLTLIDGLETLTFGATNSAAALTDIQVMLTVKDPQFYGEVVFGGSIGAGEAYMRDLYECDNLTNLIRLMVRNQSLLDGIEGGLAKLTTPIQAFLHRLNKNTQQGSRRNIAAHYDLGNDFFRLMLDPTMMYSSAVFESPEDSLEQASLNKLKCICKKLDLKVTDHVLEIGTGWGGFAIYAAQHYGCQITTTTISQAQFVLAKERIAALGLDKQITVLLTDYRDLSGQYDKLVSIEMIEAVGHQYYNTYFACCSALLKPSGMMLLQAITIVDQRYAAAIKSVDFIQRHIFPGSCIPSVTAMLNSITQSTDMRVFDLEDIGPHYARTLAEWRKNFLNRLPEVRQLGYPDTFLRMWDFYLCYCEGGFEERALGNVHLLLVKPENRRPASM
ncbi:MAG: cyclopropane-fatty-acyl-phospholipid synthase family protein [Methylotenera sp.]|nr:cyclopropane-fatty-acyl-phospholipid synthase family protein [Methylotenera sp.]